METPDIITTPGKKKAYDKLNVLEIMQTMYSHCLSLHLETSGQKPS